MKKILFVSMSALFVLFSSCKKDIYGCTDPLAKNYSSKATTDDGSCFVDVQQVFTSEFTVTFSPSSSSSVINPFTNFENGDVIIVEALADDNGTYEYWMSLPYVSSDFQIVYYYNETLGTVFIDSYDMNTDLNYSWSSTQTIKFRAALIKKNLLIMNPDVKEMSIQDLSTL